MDQRSVSFMYNRSNKGKIKNEKIQRWKLELSYFHYDVIYRPDKQNTVADTFTRNYLSYITCNDLKLLHTSLCHPGGTRLMHYVRAKNLPFSCDDIRTVIEQCQICTELKPLFFPKLTGELIKATQPFERISMDFKEPLPSVSRNRYLLTIIDEFSKFPFACPDMSSSTVFKCLNELLAVFGFQAYVHTDRGTLFMSTEGQHFLHERGIATSRTTPYNPRGNGQIERLNRTLALPSKELDIAKWELVLNDALQSIRSILCTATNRTPHEGLLGFNQRSGFGTSLPTWLTSPGPVLLKNVRSSIYDTITEEVDLVTCNPQYTVIRTPNGREETVSL
uniref:Integrase catalytic domain-containing protein n=1 Tax=Biomphalaria glabrata TaxID=6526 RepID=A0A2C9LYU2_BIOGL